MNANPAIRGVYGDSDSEEKQGVFPACMRWSCVSVVALSEGCEQHADRAERRRREWTDEERRGFNQKMKVVCVEDTGESLICECCTADLDLRHPVRLSQGLCRTFSGSMVWLPYGHLIIDRDMSPVQDLKRAHRSYLGPQGLASYIHGKSQHTAINSERNYHYNRLAERFITTTGGDA